MNFINFGTSTHLNSSQLISTHMRTMVLEYESLQNWVMNMGQVCWDSDSSTMLRIWATKNPHEASRRSSSWPWGEGPSGRSSGVGGDRGALSLGAWQVNHGFTMVYHGLAPRKKCFVFRILHDIS